MHLDLLVEEDAAKENAANLLCSNLLLSQRLACNWQPVPKGRVVGIYHPDPPASAIFYAVCQYYLALLPTC